MDDAGVGWIAAIIIGGLAGWIASRFMNSDTGVFMNVILGIIGAAVASFIFGFLGVSFGGWLGYLIAGFVGACILIWGARAVRS
ncbi:GlsB/YeaQ/YmgE family stress response membrane protein [Aquamicrobium lusatiense]|uniref:GlsB/YeaQ/YmgE family stress response membrane protein n=1 Tax=Aquamicrobium TaxID=69278 RepID=UPI00245618F4|nr:MULTISPECIES: GlsB/YeaQ/YmgE family stress response membrane protein [Aquamicrobium]MCK9551376.1 GlsB/YeaQ/YmgE family stress response membrane protein [Aquamicrobium sp.]MDH4991035.1 GlsB/YeaQ/YmgE family stress response membrane protein [Aquamicrobium lusatiense]